MKIIELADGAQNVVTLADFDGAKEHDVRFSNGFVDGNAFHSLAQVDELIETGRFWLPVDKTFPLAAIAEAHASASTVTYEAGWCSSSDSAWAALA